ncbi:MAG: bifunctional 5,10-methylenetetrahydrofolate dehydrogenase/5,10-methenyltetrahydrofolate cyclohydrolase [Patescibacteria group bacterium]
MKLIDGRQIAETIKDTIAQEIFELVKDGVNRPSLAIILVGERPDSQLYVSLKEKQAKLIGIDTHRYEFSEDTSEDELIATINFLNNDPEVDAILVQLPLPSQIDTDKIMGQLNPLKDADGFHPNHPDYVESPVIAAVGAMLDDIKIKPANLSACALYNSEVFGSALTSYLTKYGFREVDGVTSSEIRNNWPTLQNADVLVSAIGFPLFVNEEMIKHGSVIIDIGTNKLENKVVGDVNFESVKDKVSYISPVPGGVGPLTIAFLFKNVLEIYKHKNLS